MDVEADPDALRVGFDRRLDLGTDVRQVASLVDWLNRRLGVGLQVAMTTTGAGEDTLAEQICGGEVDVAVAGTLTYLQAHQRCGASMLVRGVGPDGTAEYRAAIVAQPSSGIRALEDLVGRPFAFGHRSSTQGHLIPRLMFHEAGVRVEDLASAEHADSHASAATLVRSGTVDAAAMQDTLARTLEADGTLRVVVYSDPFPTSGIMIGPQVDATIAEDLRSALLALDPAHANLHEWHRTEMPRGFIVARDGDYDTLREAAREAGLLASP